MEKDSMLTTFDNPFNPFTEFDRWWKEDLLLGHNCCGLLANESNVSDIASDEVNDKAIIEAMERIVKREPMIYKIVYQSDFNKVANG
nr:MAG TPA: hypothetical protein [Caudoviricetes sp.]